MKITEYTSDQIVIRIDLGFEYDTEAAERLIQQHQHRLTSDRYSIIASGRRDTIEGVSVVIEAIRFLAKTDLDG